MPQPINAVRTQVIEDADGLFWVLFSTDGMNWFKAHSRGYAKLSHKMAILHADDMVRWAEGVLPTGKAVWTSHE